MQQVYFSQNKSAQTTQKGKQRMEPTIKENNTRYKNN
tara:strand:- start:884 stop:994 length:111 start_codon:yes stop_codon:yes gene_type:complete